MIASAHLERFNNTLLFSVHIFFFELIALLVFRSRTFPYLLIGLFFVSYFILSLPGICWRRELEP